MTYMFILKCALKLVLKNILYYDARSEKHQINGVLVAALRAHRAVLVTVTQSSENVFCLHHTRSVREISSHFEYLENRLCGLDVTWQPVRGDFTAHP